jgi:hypothetical protein
MKLFITINVFVNLTFGMLNPAVQGLPVSHQLNSIYFNTSTEENIDKVQQNKIDLRNCNQLKGLKGLKCHFKLIDCLIVRNKPYSCIK